jgi:diguanylate cyclase (GGDEF)-like protein
VLREVTAVLLHGVRGEDTVCRYGGEEFVAILPDLGVDDAVGRAESIRHMVSELRLFQGGDALREITISIGVALFPQNGTSSDQLLNLADRALYEAKHRGRNRVVLAEQLGDFEPRHTHAEAY